MTLINDLECQTTTVTGAPTGGDWGVLVSFLPANWERLAASTGALRGLRKDKSPENLLRTLLIHLGCGHSLRETVMRARQARLANLSDVALLNRLQKSCDWLYALCIELFKEQGIAVSTRDVPQVRVFDATVVREPGRTGSTWRLHYSVTLPSLRFDSFKLTGTKGTGTDASFKQFSVHAGDCILADHGYAADAGIAHVQSRRGYVTVRVNPGALRFETNSGQPFDLLASVESLQQSGAVGVWKAAVKASAPLKGRICALRKTDEAMEEALGKIHKTTQRKGRRPCEETLRYARYVILFTTFPEATFSVTEVLDWYRLHWQVGLVLKRFKSLAQLGHVPKNDDESAQAWLYGKLLAALLTEKSIRYAQTLSPWGYDLQAYSQHTEKLQARTKSSRSSN